MKTISQLKYDTISFIGGKKKAELEKRFDGIRDDRFICGILECHLLGAIPLIKPELVVALKQNAAFTESVYRIADRVLESANIYEREVKTR